MKELCLVIYDDDYMYVEEVIKFFNKNYSSYFKVIGVTSKKELEKLIFSGRTIDILLLNEDLLRSTKEINMIKLVILLSENDRNNDIDNRVIFKYQNGHALFNCTKKIYTSINTDENFNDNSMNTKVVSFFSPIGGVGKTTLSILFSNRLTKEGRKVLYLTLEQISGLGAYFDVSDRNNTIADLFYKASEGIEIKELDLKKVIKRDKSTNVYYINPVNSTLDFEELTGNNLKYILDSIKKSMNFDYIVIDSGSRLDNSISRLQEYADKSVGIVDTTNLSMIKMSKMLDEFINIDNILILINKYRLNHDQGINTDYKNLDDNIYSYISYDSCLENNNINLELILNAELINIKVNDFTYKLLREEWIVE
ncbi:AAA family ATPase [Clostridium paraputrificum]|uniref:AAA family ATPase n=1 Tax=Clostridium paraputrificum TaxID=29363 RepID=UPI003D33A6BD